MKWYRPVLKRFGFHFRHNVVAYLALFFALGGTAIAVPPLLTGANIQDGSLTGADVSDNSTLKGVDIDEADLGKVPSAANADNAAHADQADDADTLDGLDSTELGGGALDVQTVEGCAGTCTSAYYNEYLQAFAACPAGTTVTGGGFRVVPGRYHSGVRQPVLEVRENAQFLNAAGDEAGWVVTIKVQTLSFQDLKVYALCATL